MPNLASCTQQLSASLGKLLNLFGTLFAHLEKEDMMSISQGSGEDRIVCKKPRARRVVALEI